ncbi:MAG: RdgB/HAM1 family non-canonical purine NTP pyrophosphatase [Vulcanimicrobiota bacterium]
MKLLVATGNPHKVEELRRILGDAPCELVTLSEYPDLAEPEETGTTFLENARLKSRYYCQATGLAAVADDSGLEVDALGGQPGVYSARFAGGDTPHSVKMAKVLELLAEIPDQPRTARFRCVAALTFPDGRELHAEGALEGVIAAAPSGTGGFGYDPIVYIPELGQTVAEIGDQKKDELSHRGKAFRALVSELLGSPKTA